MTATEARKLSPEEIEQGLRQYLPLARSVVRRLLRTTSVPSRFLDLDELYGAALRGLWEALRSYDPGKEGRLESRIYQICYGRVMDEVRKLTGARHQGGRLKRVGKSVRPTHRLNYQPEPESDEVDMACPRSEIEARSRMAAETIEECRKELTAREWFVLSSIYLEGFTQAALARQLDVTQSYISRLLADLRGRLIEVAGKLSREGRV